MGPKKRPTPRRKSTKVQDLTTLEKGRGVGGHGTKQARTKKHEPVDISSHPSYSFVTLKISSAKLQLLGFPPTQSSWKPHNPAWAGTISASEHSDRDSTPRIFDEVNLSLATSSRLRPSPNSSQELHHNQQSTLDRPHKQGAKRSRLGQPLPEPTRLYTPVSTLPGSRQFVFHASGSGSRSSAPDLKARHEGLSEVEMAPVRDPNSVQSSIKDVVQDLFEVQTQVHGFVPETQPLLINKMSELAQSLAHLQKITSPTLSPNNPIHQTRIAPEIIDYVDDGRNPDIFTRDFVELVQRGNAVINGKQQAFRDFAEVFADALKDGIEGVEDEVNQVLKNSHGGSGSRVQESNKNGLSRI